MTEGEQHVPGSGAWMHFLRFWTAYVDALERHLDRIDRFANNEKKDCDEKPRPKPRM